MRIFAFVLAALCTFALASTVHARPKITKKTSHYDVKGKTGKEILRQINRKGPRHGFLVRAIAQTRYSLSYGYEYQQTAKDCRITKATVTMDIEYVYPRLGNKVSGNLNKRWKRFMNGVRKHEEIHGRLASEMASATEKTILSTRASGKRGCRQIKQVVKRNVDKVFKKYEAQQVAFDKKEHRDNGNVEKMITALVKK